MSAFTEGIGFTTIEKDMLFPTQEFDMGVTVNTLTIGRKEPPVLVVKAVISPEPEVADKPIRFPLCVVQLYIVLAALDPEKLILSVRVPLHFT